MWIGDIPRCLVYELNVAIHKWCCYFVFKWGLKIYDNKCFLFVVTTTHACRNLTPFSHFFLCISVFLAGLHRPVSVGVLALKLNKTFKIIDNRANWDKKEIITEIKVDACVCTVCVRAWKIVCIWWCWIISNLSQFKCSLYIIKMFKLNGFTSTRITACICFIILPKRE